MQKRKENKRRMRINVIQTNKYSKKGITLIALVITIIIFLILAGVVITLTIGEDGLLRTAKNATTSYEEQQAREKLEIVLVDLQAAKVTDTNYNENDYINTRIQNEEMIVNGDIIFVDEWQFQIDRSIPQIIAS